MSRKRKPNNTVTHATFTLDGQRVKVKGHKRSIKARTEIARLRKLLAGDTE